MSFTTITAVARKIPCNPKDISDAFYRRQLSNEECPMIGNRRLIPTSYVPTIRRLMKEKAKRREESAAGV